MISTLHKYPWHAVQHVTLKERYWLFLATADLITALVNSIRNGKVPDQITRRLMQELVLAALTTGFSVEQKNCICQGVIFYGFGDLLHGTPFIPFGMLSKCWKFEVLDRKVEVSLEVLQVRYTHSFSLRPTGTEEIGMEDFTDIYNSTMSLS